MAMYVGEALAGEGNEIAHIDLLVGEKDFKSFAAAKDHRTDSIRKIFRCDVYSGEPSDANPKEGGRAKKDEWVYVDVEGNRFLYNMVRNIVGTLVEVGVGRMSAEKMTEILEAREGYMVWSWVKNRVSDKPFGKNIIPDFCFQLAQRAII